MLRNSLMRGKPKENYFMKPLHDSLPTEPPARKKSHPNRGFLKVELRVQFNGLTARRVLIDPRLADIEGIPIRERTNSSVESVVQFFNHSQKNSRASPLCNSQKNKEHSSLRSIFKRKVSQQVIQSFQEHFPERQSPTKMTIWRNVTRYRTEGTSLNLKKGLSGRKRTGRSEENVRNVQGALTENPQISARKNGLDVTKSTFNRIITLDLKWHPYKMHVRKVKN
ncbi:Protein of unknown function DUF4817 [Trinorchestia longiramus]|nr:Protein of unknown function DUF4817 [Trinorchestia longiramus]